MLSHAFCCYGKHCCGFVPLKKSEVGAWVCCLNEVCGDKHVQEYTMYVLTSTSLYVREIEGPLSVFWPFSQIPHTKLSLLNCQDCTIAREVVF